jgi:hypothetical protein
MGELGSQMGENAHKFGLVESLRLRQLHQIHFLPQRVRLPRRCALTHPPAATATRAVTGRSGAQAGLQEGIFEVWAWD